MFKKDSTSCLGQTIKAQQASLHPLLMSDDFSNDFVPREGWLRFIADDERDLFDNSERVRAFYETYRFARETYPNEKT